MILYGIKKVILTELDPTTGLPKSVDGITTTITTAEEAEMTPVISEGAEEVLRSSDKILAVVREDDLLYGIDLKFKDNTFDEKCAQLIAGYKATKESSGEAITKLSTPMMSEGNLAKPFKMEIFVAQYEGDAIVGYVKIVLNKCLGKFPTIKVGKEFYAPEFEVKARENTAATLPVQDLEFVKTLA